MAHSPTIHGDALKRATEAKGFVPGVRIQVGCGRRSRNLRYGVVSEVNQNGTLNVTRMEDGKFDLDCINPNRAVSIARV